MVPVMIVCPQSAADTGPGPWSVNGIFGRDGPENGPGEIRFPGFHHSPAG